MSKKNRSPWRKSSSTAPAPTEPRAQASGFPRLSSASDPVVDLSPISPVQLAANRANAQLSTGPRTDSGREKSSKNAIKSALTGRTVLLPADDVEEYAAFLSQWQKRFQPVDGIETELLQIIVDCHWRLRRIQDLENALYLHGERQFETMFANEPTTTRQSMIMLQTHLTYQKEFRNLHIQESRIDRKRAKMLKELEQLQAERKSAENPAAPSAMDGFSSESELFAAMDAGYLPPHMAEYLAKQKELEENGFDFSNEEKQAA